MRSDRVGDLLAMLVYRMLSGYYITWIQSDIISIVIKLGEMRDCVFKFLD